MSDTTSVTVGAKRYQELLDSELLLACLQSCGVDNWDWYGEAVAEYQQAKDQLQKEKGEVE